MKETERFNNQSIYLERYIHEGTITIAQALDGEVVAQMDAETLLPVEGRPSGEVAPRKAWPCGAGMAAEMGIFSGISPNLRSSLIREDQR